MELSIIIGTSPPDACLRIIFAKSLNLRSILQSVGDGCRLIMDDYRFRNIVSNVRIFLQNHLSSTVHHPSSIIHHPSSIIHHPSSIIHRPLSILRVLGLIRKSTEVLRKVIIAKIGTIAYEHGKLDIVTHSLESDDG